jgi:predicted DNA-binding transcriptional regulator YafY
MSAERLIDLVQLLQTHPRRSVRALAHDLAVSVRTVHRDLDALALAGVPIVKMRGVRGGVGLRDGFRLRLRGMTSDELAALAGLGIPQALEDLGLGRSLRSGFSKLTAALGTRDRPVLEHARQRLHMDAAPWFGEREQVPHLAALRDAVWRDLRVRIRYRDMDDAVSRLLVDPLGLVIKAERWYLVAAAPSGTRVYRCARIQALELLERSFRRPDRFELSEFWAAHCTRFARSRARFEVVLEVDRQGEQALRRLRPSSDGPRFETATPTAAGLKRVTLDFERIQIAIATLSVLAPHVRVLVPTTLRRELAEMAARLTATYLDTR